MQKLVKKTRHYQTLVPVEAYQGEEGYFLQEETDDFLVGFSCGFGIRSAMSGFTAGAVVGLATCGVALANTDTGREVIADTFEAMAEYQEAEREAYRMAGETIGDVIADGIDAIADGVEAIGDALDDMEPGPGGGYSRELHH